jgi:filamentous hemagglutinin
MSNNRYISEQRSGLLTMSSQVLGVLVASMAGGDEKDMQVGASVAGNATKYNWDLHLPLGAMQYGQSATSLAQHMQEQGVTPEEISSALHAMARGDGFDGPEPANRVC